MKRRRRAERKEDRAEELRLRRAQKVAVPTISPWHKLKKVMKPVDGIILIVAVVYVTALLDFSAMTLPDVFYLTAIIMWAGSFIVRLYLLSKRDDW